MKQEASDYANSKKIRNEEQYIKTIVYLAGLFKRGKADVSIIADVYAYNKEKGVDWDYVDTKIDSMGLGRFHLNIIKLADMWFDEWFEGTRGEKRFLKKMGRIS